MKKSKIKYSTIVDYYKIEKNYLEIKKNTKHKEKIAKWDMFHSVNINNIYMTLKNRNYKHERYNIFLIRDPKYRIVMSESVRNKIINHIVSNYILKPIIYPKLIDENVATRVGMGTNKAIKLCKKFFLDMTNKYGNFYVLKYDISKYFYNIDHEILKQMMKDIYEDKKIIKILDEIIDSTDHKYVNEQIEYFVNHEIDKINNVKKQEELKRIPFYYKGKGLGIGSLTNQIFAIFYLNPLDHYIKETLRYKNYVRFMDDGIIFSTSKEELECVKELIKNKLDELKLKLNDKSRIYSAKEGFDFVGYRFVLKNGKMVVRVKNQTKNKMKHKFKVLSKYDLDKLNRVKASYKGVLLYSNVKGLYKKYYKNV